MEFLDRQNPRLEELDVFLVGAFESESFFVHCGTKNVLHVTRTGLPLYVICQVSGYLPFSERVCSVKEPLMI